MTVAIVPCHDCGDRSVVRCAVESWRNRGRIQIASPLSFTRCCISLCQPDPAAHIADADASPRREHCSVLDPPTGTGDRGLHALTPLKREFLIAHHGAKGNTAAPAVGYQHGGDGTVAVAGVGAVLANVTSVLQNDEIRRGEFDRRHVAENAISRCVDHASVGAADAPHTGDAADAQLGLRGTARARRARSGPTWN